LHGAGRMPALPGPIVIRGLGDYNAGMFEQSMDLSDVFAKLKRADESLSEFVAPLWPGVSLAAAWVEGQPRLYKLQGVPPEEGYYLLHVEEDVATVLHAVSDEEARKYRGYLAKTSVILLEHGLAFPASFAERLQGITKPRPIRFAEGAPLQQVASRFDGVNLLFDGAPAADKSSPLAGLFSGSSIFTPGELLGMPGTEKGSEDAALAQAAIIEHPTLDTQYRLEAILDSAHAELLDWSPAGEMLRVLWRKDNVEHTTLLHSTASPITCGICLPGVRTSFDPGALTRLLIDHALDAWE
ncbi:MAG TPA: hypothetical protein VGM23_12435, partial [Armatimonadota bacterium]